MYVSVAFEPVILQLILTYSVSLYSEAHVLFTYFCNGKLRKITELCKYRLALRIHPCNFFFFNLILFRGNRVKP